MTLFDTDVLVEILIGNSRFVKRASESPHDQQGVTIVTVEEVLRGRLLAIRQAEAGKGPIIVARAYELLELSVNDFQRLTVVSYTDGADRRFQDFRRRIRVSTHDLCIAAICMDHSATLVSRNRRDFEQIPGLSVEFWE